MLSVDQFNQNCPEGHFYSFLTRRCQKILDLDQPIVMVGNQDTGQQTFSIWELIVFVLIALVAVLGIRKLSKK